MTAGSRDGAAVLREAARVMRERAEAATPGPWRIGQEGDGTPCIINGWNIDDNTLSVTIFGKPSDPAHIASWHPAVALAVADWLDDIGRTHTPVRRHVGNVTHGGPAQYADVCRTCPGLQLDYPCGPAGRALAVATAYLNGESP